MSLEGGGPVIEESGNARQAYVGGVERARFGEIFLRAGATTALARDRAVAVIVVVVAVVVIVTLVIKVIVVIEPTSPAA